MKVADKEVAPVPYTQTKFEDTPKVPSEIINPPGVVHITKLATPVSLANNVEPSKSRQQMQILVAPPPPKLNEKNGSSQQGSEVVDMEIEDQNDENDDSLASTDSSVKDKTLPKTILPNMSLPPPGYESKTQASTNQATTAFPPCGPPPFLMNSIINPASTEQVSHSFSNSLFSY